EKQIGRDGIAVIVKPENPIQDLTVEQLRGIYTGGIKNWKELGGQDLPVDFDRLSPEWSETGWFRKHVMKDDPYGGSGDVRDRFQMLMAHFFESGPGSIVFMSYGPIEYVNKRFGKDRYKIVRVRTDANVTGVAPSQETCADGTYPLARDIYLVWNSKDTSPAIGKFAGYCAANGVQPTKMAGARDSAAAAR
ncbi:MAG: substrate-binding domain-containing protein, partial [Pseudomonadota bacterium]